MRPDLAAALGALDTQLPHRLRDGRPQYVLFGSVVMALHGINRDVGDIDMFVTEPTWQRLLGLGWHKRWPNPDHPPLLAWQAGPIEANAWCRWDEHHWEGDIVADAFASAHLVRGWQCQPLAQLAHWKELVGRAKDRPDVEAIAAHRYTGCMWCDRDHWRPRT